MRAIARTSGHATALLLAGAAVLAVPAAAQASAAAPAVTGVPCSGSALVTAISQANATGSASLHLSVGCDYVLSTPAVTGNGLPTITGHLEMTGGSGTGISRDPSAPAFRLVTVASGASLTLGGVTLTNGSTTGLGGAILDQGTLAMRNVTLSENTAGNGGGLSVAAGARATVSGSDFEDNQTKSVGGGGIINFGDLTVDRSTLTGNHAPINGGGLNNQPGGTSRVTSTTVSHNTSNGLGGGISNLGTLDLVHATVQFNRGSGGGGLATSNQNVSVLVSRVANNTPDNCSPLNTVPGCVG